MNSTATKSKTNSKKQQIPAGVPAGAKELEPQVDIRAQETAAIAEIREVSDSHDKEALRLVRESLPETKPSEPKPEISSDVADVGVTSPEQEAAAVLTNGPTINVDITEAEYKKGLKMGVEGKTDHEKTVFGTASLVALALWVKRVVTLAHKHTKRIIFRKGQNAD